MPETPDRDISADTEEKMDDAEGSDDQTRLETLEEVQRNLESELDEGAETPPA
jgi:hypothetical protein